jgi:predicted phosphodiesterase
MALPLHRVACILLLAVPFQIEANQEAKPDSRPTKVKIVVSGDVQFRSGRDYWSGGLKYRKAVIAGMAAEKADIVLLNGDLAEKGASKGDWELFDREIKPLLQSTALFLAAIGNHDLHGDEREARENFFTRVKAAQGRDYYSVQRGPVMLIILNSNAPLAHGSEQRKWLEHEIAAVPQSVKYVITSMHHPMRTRSRRRGLTRGHEALPEHKELGDWLESIARQAHYRIIAFSGHVHNYERYEENGVMFIVSGGAGGRPHDIKRQPQDAYTGSGPTYHYCVIEADAAELRFRMRKYDTGAKQWKDADAFRVGAVE